MNATHVLMCERGEWFAPTAIADWFAMFRHAYTAAQLADAREHFERGEPWILERPKMGRAMFAPVTLPA